MEQAIVTSEGGVTKRTYVLLTLNIVGAIGCVVITILLILWTQNLIFPEPNICPVIKDYIDEFRNQSVRTSVDMDMFDIDDFWEGTEPIDPGDEY